MTEEDFQRARELLRNPDAEDCERFSSRYGTELLDIAERQPALLAALRVAQHTLVAAHNYRATDLSVESFDAHLANGVPRDQLEFMTDYTADLALIDAAITEAER